MSTELKVFVGFLVWMFLMLATIANIEMKNKVQIECYKAAQVNHNVKCEVEE